MNISGGLYKRKKSHAKLVLPLVLQIPEGKEPYLITIIFLQMLTIMSDAE